MRSREARNVFTRLAELSVHGANVQKGQIVLVQAEIGLEEQARATAEAAYKRGAKFGDVAYFDPYLKRVRIESPDPDTLDFVPQWYGERVLEHAEQNGARISMRGVTAPHVMDGLDKSRLGKDMLPSVKETFKVVSERSTTDASPTRCSRARRRGLLGGELRRHRHWPRIVPAASLCGSALRTDRRPCDLLRAAARCALAGGCRRRPVHLCRPVRPALRGDEHRAACGARVGDRASSAGVHDPVRRRCARRAPKPAPGRWSPPRHRRSRGDRRRSRPRRPSSGSSARCRVGGIVGLRERRDSRGQAEAALSLLVWSSVVAPVPLLGLSLVFEGTGRWQTAMSSVGASGIAALAYVVVVSTFFGYGVWYWLISRYPASTVAPFTLLVPVVGILTAWLVRGEHPTWGELLGSLVVLVGLGLALGVVDALAVPRRTAARVPAPTPTPRN